MMTNKISNRLITLFFLTLVSLGTIFSSLNLLTDKVLAISVEKPSHYYQINHNAFSYTKQLGGEKTASSTLHPTEIGLVKASIPTPGSSLNTGQVITYILSLTNLGNITAANVSVVDVLPIYTYFAIGQTTNGMLKQANGVLTWTIPSLAVTQSATSTFQVTMTELIDSNTIITNIAYLSSSNVTTLVTSNLVTHTIHKNQVIFSVFIPLLLKNYPPPPPKFTNPDFETVPDNAWSQVSICCPNALIVNERILPGSVTTHSGNYLAWLGGRDNEISDLSQTVEIPPGYSFLKLSYWYWIASNDNCGNDFGYIQANDTTLFTHDLCKDNDTNGWVKNTIEVTGYAGQIVTFHFIAALNGSKNSNLFIDDVFFE